MDCNREEALRAKQLAEKKMEIKDFSGALKIAVKAQQLYPELENVSQMILVCEVHCSAEKKSYGTDKDWYGILKIEPSADDLSIKKQYRKLALVLHPDKNKFAGSTDAFKLIGEAQRVLLDREKRMIHDSKRRAFGNISAPNWAPKQPGKQSNVHQQHHPWNQGHSVNYTPVRTGNFSFTQQWPPTGVSGNRPTFWTVCPFCSVRYQFYRDDVLNKVIHCQSCKKSFTAYELNAQGAAAPAPTTHKHPSYHQQNRVPSKPTEGAHRGYTTKPVFGGVKEPSKPQVKTNNRKRKKRIEESSESSDSSSESEEDVEEHSEGDNNGVPKNVGKNPDYEDFQYFGEQPRRSSRSKRNVSYKENVNIDDDDATPSNPAAAEKRAEDAFWKEEVREVGEDHKKEEDNKKSSETANDDNTEEEGEPQVFECPDPEFTDFENARKQEKFNAGQIWACYDTEDAMPRFYAFIRKVSPGFQLQITWLKPDPVTPDEKQWVEKELPVSCGRFRRGKHDTSEDLLSFSHLVSWEAGPRAGTFSIVPRKGEMWALFKNWSMKWHLSTDEEIKYEYEFVEILSDYDEDAGVRVSYLEKVKGFVSLFRRKEDGEMVIAGSDKYRFAHMVPSCRMSGEERQGVPKGSYELDPACLPASIFEQVNL